MIRTSAVQTYVKAVDSSCGEGGRSRVQKLLGDVDFAHEHGTPQRGLAHAVLCVKGKILENVKEKFEISYASETGKACTLTFPIVST